MHIEWISSSSTSRESWNHIKPALVRLNFMYQYSVKMESCKSKSCFRRNNTHVILLPYPAQGHVAPFMKLSHRLSDFGIKVTLIVTEFMYERMVSDLRASESQNGVRMVTIPDGLGPDENREDFSTLAYSFLTVMPIHLENIIKKVNQCDDDKITCVIADPVMSGALGVASKMGIKKATFLTSSPGVLAFILHVPRLIEAGIIDPQGNATKSDEIIHLSPNLPPLAMHELIWNFLGDKSMENMVFQCTLAICQNLKDSNWVLCNWFNSLDPSAESLMSNVLTVGPLLANGRATGNLYTEDITCLTWLDKQSPNSVIYISFGSTSILSHQQFEELALGLELTGRPFLWVVRPNVMDREYPENFIERVSNVGKTVEWAPQEKVLGHPSIVCFLTHCGWNSTIEGISNGVPLLCWPYFADQLYNKSCVCDGWKVGLGLNCDEEDKVISRHEVKMKVDELIGNEEIRANSLKLKEKTKISVLQGGSSCNNLEYFVQQLLML